MWVELVTSKITGTSLGDASLANASAAALVRTPERCEQLSGRPNTCVDFESFCIKMESCIFSNAPTGTGNQNSSRIDFSEFVVIIEPKEIEESHHYY